MEPEDIDAVIAGFGAAGRIACAAGLDGVEVNAGQHSLVRQFLSGLTNHRGDEWGVDRVLLRPHGARRPYAPPCGPNRIVGLRLSCDELAPWAGIKAEDGAGAGVDRWWTASTTWWW